MEVSEFGDLFRPKLDLLFARFFASALARSLLGFFHGFLKALKIDAQPAFLGHQIGEVDGEAVGVVELEGVGAGDGARV